MTLSLSLSIVIPAKNEARALADFLPKLRAQMPEAEIILVDDGSTDETASLGEAAGVRVLRSPYSMGNGAAIKRGARAARGDVLVFMDGDGQHDPADIPRLLASLMRASIWWSAPVIAPVRPTSGAVSPTRSTIVSPVG